MAKGRVPFLSWKWKWKWKWRPPLLFQSKLLCLSVLYLLTTMCISLYASFSQSGLSCFLSSFYPSRDNYRHFRITSDHLHSYPPSYGEHKYALPTPSPSSSCNSPLFFPDYRVAYEEIRDLCRNGSTWNSSLDLDYLGAGYGLGGTFAGNFSTARRRSYFDQGDGNNSDAKVPCGFLTEFPVADSDRSAMEKCDGVVVASAIFNDHDKIRQPKGLGAATLRSACFFMFIDDATANALASHNLLPSAPPNNTTATDNDEKAAWPRPTKIGAWQIAWVPTRRLPYDQNPAMNGVIPKHLIHRLFPNAKFSVWVDAKLQLTVDPLLLLHSLVVSKGVDMAISKHPFNVHTMEEAMATARWNKWGTVDELRHQMEAYCQNGLQPWSSDKLPYETDVPDTALILRRHGFRSNLFSCLLFNELEAFNPRDQLAFAYVRDFMNPKIKIHMFEVEVFEHIAIEYRHNLKPTKTNSNAKKMGKSKKVSFSSASINDSSCRDYLLKMWGEWAAD